MVFTKKQKRFLSRVLNQGEAVYDQMSTSLLEESRVFYEDEATYEFGFVDFEDEMTDEEIDEWFNLNMRRHVPYHMYWDCTGCTFTAWIDWHRNPNGLVSFVHRMDIDN